MEQVIIVGGGPVGLTLALILARYEVPVLLLEARAHPTPRDESRAITWMPRGLELLDWLGLGAEVAQQGLRRTAHEFWVGHRHLLTLPFDQVDSPHRATLQLPQHDSEVLLAAAALATGRVEIRRSHRVAAIGQQADRAWLRVESPAGTDELTAPWAVGCDGFHSEVRRQLGIPLRWRDYGTDSAVADFELYCDLSPERSRIVLDPRRPYGFFAFAPGRWRFVYRLNAGEDRAAMTSEAAATGLLQRVLPGVRVHRFLWASAFRLGQGQSARYRQGRWLLAGDAAHAMGPSAGAGMMIGVLGAWRLGWRLALAAGGQPLGERLLDDYDREQHVGADEVQAANATIFRNMALTNPVLAAVRSLALGRLAHVPALVRRLTETEALLRQRLPVREAADQVGSGPWLPVDRLGAWRVGWRMPTPTVLAGLMRPEQVGLAHVVVPIGWPDVTAEAALAEAVRQRFPLPVRLVTPPPSQSTAWRALAATRPALALVRPDDQVVVLLQAAGS